MRSDSFDLAPELESFIESTQRVLRALVVTESPEGAAPNLSVMIWCYGLGTLAWDVSGSALTLLRAGHIRAAVMLNRSLFEYWVRLKYYTKHPDVAEQNLRQIPTRFMKIVQGHPHFRRDHLADDEADAMEAWFTGGVKIKRENFRNDVLNGALDKDVADMYYETFYSLASSFVHGYETMLDDVLMMRDHERRQTIKEPAWSSERLRGNDTGQIVVAHLLSMCDAQRAAKGLAHDDTLDKLFDGLQASLVGLGKLPRPMH
jgi:hypothetical protein